MPNDDTQDASEMRAAFAEVYRALGFIASAYATVEADARLLFQELVLSPRGREVADNLDTSRVINLCYVLLKAHPMTDLARDRVRLALAAARHAGVKRNDLIHASWHLTQGAEGGPYSGVGMPSKVSRPATRATPEELAQHGETMMYVPVLLEEAVWYVESRQAPPDDRVFQDVVTRLDQAWPGWQS